jgi:hypothetical protein
METTGLPCPVAASSLHATLLYSRKVVRTKAKPEVEMRALPTGFHIFKHASDKTSALVILLDSPAMHHRHGEFLRLGGEHDYPTFQPHLTLTYDIGDFDWKHLSLPGFSMTFTGETIEALKP